MSLTCRTLLSRALASSSPFRLRRPRDIKISRPLTTARTTDQPSATTPAPPTRSSRPATSSAPRSGSAAPPRSPDSAPPWRKKTSRSSPLKPYKVSERLTALCKRGDVDLAVATLQRAPRKSQNIKVWNTLIRLCMDAERYNLAYRVLTDLKRRGFVPNVRTFATLMGGYAAVEDWAAFPKQLENAHSAYTQLKQLLEGSPEPVREPRASFALYTVALYISILGKAGEYKRAFDVFHELDADGPLQPHPKVYSSLLCVLADRLDSAEAEQRQGTSIVAESLSDAKYVWRRQMRSLDRQPQHPIDPRSVEAMIKVLSWGEPSDHELMFDILRDICGLPRPGEGEDGGEGKGDDDRPSSPPTPPKVALTSWILAEALDGSVAAGRPDMAVHYAQSAMDSVARAPKHRWDLLRPSHLNALLRAHVLLAKEGSTSPSRSENAAAWVEWMATAATARVAQGGQKGVESGQNVPRPLNERAVASALELCHLCRDASSALRITRLILEGGRGGGSMPGSGSSSDSGSSPGAAAHHAGFASDAMSARAWTHLFRLAIAASPDERRQCLELLNAHRSVLDVWGSGSASATERLPPPEKMWHESLARCILKAIRLRNDPRSSPPSSPDRDGAESVDLGQREAWSDLRRRAETLLEGAHGRMDRSKRREGRGKEEGSRQERGQRGKGRDQKVHQR